MDENELKKMFSSPDPKERINTVNAIIKGGIQNKLEILTWVSQNDPHAQVRSKVRAVVDQMQKAKIQTLPKEASAETQKRETPEEILKNGAAPDKIETLKRIINGSISIDKEIIKGLLEIEKDIMINASLIIALGKLGGETELHLIGKFLNNSNARIRANAVEAIEFIGSSMAFEYIKPLLVDPDSRVKANAAKCLFTCDRSKALKTMEEMVTSNDITSIKSGIYALKTVDDIEAKKLLNFATSKVSKSEPRKNELSIEFTPKNQNTHTTVRKPTVETKICPFCAEKIPNDAKECLYCKESETKVCPYCGEEILTVAKKCKHCGEFISEAGFGGMMPAMMNQLQNNDSLGTGWFVVIWGSLLLGALGGWIIVILSSIMYYSWKNQYPNKAKTINRHGWMAFIVAHIITFLWLFAELSG